MPTTSLILNGYGVLNGVKIKNHSHGGNQNEGSIDITGGTSPFEPDDIIVLTVLNPDGNNEVTHDSLIMGQVVYDSAADYYAGTPKYTYDSAYGVGIRQGSNGMGDTYLRISAGSMTTSDPGAPQLGQMLFAAGVDLSGVPGGATVSIDRFSDNDYDGNSTIDGGTTEEGNGLFATENNVYSGITPVCFARGSLIECTDGPGLVETLRPGDWVNTLDHGPQQLRWIGSRTSPATGVNAPVRIRAGAIGNVRDLWVSQNHRMLVRGPMAELFFGEHEVLIAAKHLVNDMTIRIVARPQIEYYHFLFDAHQIVFAEACPCESLYLGAQLQDSATPEALDEIIQLFPEVSQSDFSGPMSRYELKSHEALIWQSQTAPPTRAGLRLQAAVH